MKKQVKSLKKNVRKAALYIPKFVRKIKSKLTRKSLKIKKIKKTSVSASVRPKETQITPKTCSPPKYSGFELPAKYGENKLVLLVRDPWWLYAYWEATPEREMEILDLVRRSAKSIEAKVLRVYDITDKSLPDYNVSFDIEIGVATNWYVDVGKPDRRWVAELGFRTHRGRFFSLVRSNFVCTPRFGVSDVLDEEWLLPDELYWKIFGLSGGLGTQKSSLDVKEVLERYLRGLGASENSGRSALGKKQKTNDTRFIFSSDKVSA
ncbi:MAG: DUF4912 domain-containing protein [Candidatus Omnitrophica bacterium CG07_land_8_20_14_0_80_50_8]|nr:MAG: DUF4912 domain-containing protein [Candidatus Omnitrophica bacterium CG07_land_8_20_14_0_80_50_8]